MSAPGPFSILERIDVGETHVARVVLLVQQAFSILERIDVGETLGTGRESELQALTFSILERIDVGETQIFPHIHWRDKNFQYPRTDRRG